MSQITRRQLLKGVGGFALVVSLPACLKPGGSNAPTPVPPSVTASPPAGLKEAARIGAFLEFHPDGSVVLVMPSCEMGQGAQTGLAQILADELDADWNAVRLTMAPVDAAYKNPGMGAMLTGGSNSVEGWWEALRQAGATGRTLLVNAAASRWGVDPSTCQTQDSKVTSGDRVATYAELVGEAAALPMPEKVERKDPSQFRVIGQSKARVEVADKCQGKTVFGIDVVRPGMVQAAVTNAPVFGSKLVSMNEKEALAQPGVLQVVKVTGGVAVVADTYWRARKGLEQLKPVFEGGEALDSSALWTRLEKAMETEGQGENLKGDPDGTLKQCKTVLERIYSAPFLAHAPMEPINCTAEVTAEKAVVWVPTQVQDKVAQAVAEASGLPLDKVEVNTTFLGGGFGRRLESDYATQATEIARAVGKPVKMIWSREETTQHGFYRPASLVRFKLGLDESGLPQAWQVRLAGPPKRLMPNGDDSVLTRGLREPHYATDNFRFDYVKTPTAVPIGYWRSVSHSHTGFYLESLLDEVARETGQDPVELRTRLLKNHPRHLAVLKLAAEKANWGKPAKGRFQGVALHESFGSIVAQVVEISLQDDKVKVHDIHCAVDWGVAVNPDLIATQMEGGAVFALTAAFYGQITLEGGRVKESNFHNYKMVLMKQAPQVHTHIVPSQEPPGGIGEPVVPPLAPALASAIVAAGGPRVRKLPISQHGLKLV